MHQIAPLTTSKSKKALTIPPPPPPPPPSLAPLARARSLRSLARYFLPPPLKFVVCERLQLRGNILADKLAMTLKMCDYNDCRH